ncbi:MAG: hypothetical protein AB1631_33565 [Acidobacteriota bacterium]
MAGKEKFVFTFVDLYGEKPKETVSVSVRHTVLSSSANAPKHDASKRLTIDGLDSSNGGRYLVQVFPARYRPEGLFLKIREDETLQHPFTLVPDPDKVARVDFPPYANLGADLKQVLERSNVEGNTGQKGEALYQALDDIRKAGLLNLYAKMKSARFGNNRDSFSYVASLRRIRGERFFADVDRAMRDEVKNSQHTRLFEEVPGALHHPPPGYLLDDSFKTLDKSGNLQLTFFRKEDALEFIIDADIDRSRGLEHVFDVISHTITNKDTHPYDVHAILFKDQKIDADYRLIV